MKEKRKLKAKECANILLTASSHILARFHSYMKLLNPETSVRSLSILPDQISLLLVAMFYGGSIFPYPRTARFQCSSRVLDNGPAVSLLIILTSHRLPVLL